MPRSELDPSNIMQVGMGFWASKTLLSAVELGLFTLVDTEPLTGPQIAERLGLHPRAVYDFLDSLVALRLLERDGEGADRQYRNTAQTAAFLNRRSPDYIGGILEITCWPAPAVRESPTSSHDAFESICIGASSEATQQFKVPAAIE